MKISSNKHVTKNGIVKRNPRKFPNSPQLIHDSQGWLVLYAGGHKGESFSTKRDALDFIEDLKMDGIK